MFKIGRFYCIKDIKFATHTHCVDSLNDSIFNIVINIEIIHTIKRQQTFSDNSLDEVLVSNN